MRQIQTIIRNNMSGQRLYVPIDNYMTPVVMNGLSATQNAMRDAYELKQLRAQYKPVKHALHIRTQQPPTTKGQFKGANVLRHGHF